MAMSRKTNHIWPLVALLTLLALFGLNCNSCNEAEQKAAAPEKQVVATETPKVQGVVPSATTPAYKQQTQSAPLKPTRVGNIRRLVKTRKFENNLKRPLPAKPMQHSTKTVVKHSHDSHAKRPHLNVGDKGIILTPKMKQPGMYPVFHVWKNLDPRQPGCVVKPQDKVTVLGEDNSKGELYYKVKAPKCEGFIRDKYVAKSVNESISK